MKIENKCHGCTRRIAGCHATCEDYKVYVEANERRKAARHEAARQEMAEGRRSRQIYGAGWKRRAQRYSAEVTPKSVMKGED